MCVDIYCCEGAIQGSYEQLFDIDIQRGQLDIDKIEYLDNTCACKSDQFKEGETKEKKKKLSHSLRVKS